MSNYTEFELKREEVRGIFTIGVIAAIIGYWQFYSHIVSALEKTTNGALILVTIDYVFIVLLVFWGLYILLTALSLSPSNSPSQFDSLFRALKMDALLFYWVGSFVTVALFAFFLFFIAAYFISTLTEQEFGGLVATVGLVEFLLVMFRARIERWLKELEGRQRYPEYD